MICVSNITKNKEMIVRANFEDKIGKFIGFVYNYYLFSCKMTNEIIVT